MPILRLEDNIGKYSCFEEVPCSAFCREDVESDYHASKTVHTILTLGYMEYIDDTLVLTERGGMLMRNVSSDLPPADRTVCYKF